MSANAPGANRFNGRFYPLDSFDQHLCLKPPLGLVLCLIFLCRDFLFALVGAVTSLKGPGVDMNSMAPHQHKLIFVAGMIPAMFVLWAYIRRVPRSSWVARWAWGHGAKLLSVAAIIQSIPALLEIRQPRAPWMLLLTAVMLAYLYLSKRVRDAFADFPQA